MAGRLSKKRIDVIKRAASVLDERPFAVYTFPPVTGPLSTQQHIAPKDIEMKFVSDDFDGLDLFPGADNAKKAECLNTLVVVWAAAVEKVRAWEAEGMNAHIIVEHYPDLADLTPAEIDYSQIDPWIVEVPCPWRIDKPALVELFWSSPPSNNNNESRKFGKPAFPFQRRLRESKRDEIVLYENFVDTREFFKIDIGDREGWGRAEREKIEHELEEKKRELRHLGMEETDFKTFLAMEKTPSETLTPREKLGLKTSQEMLGLEWRLSAFLWAGKTAKTPFFDLFALKKR